ncbi:glycosyltransferase [Gottfriedia acidiceleris]|uniref:Bifunctional glycosyltransferase family 2 protein/class I SAM-dependent methyltransferase n=1 Tax=Gottfriedia acidiceleris TaxID=371036 RepID=A0ABY4JQL5_9BACI|nr:glycosyltransferase [Gottfriedia acidiceleris]UPM55148.1 bifunctional glycosyltransferase family 2 protein/class I SAM-dependent methyltransferase [Gottfriedia acidiceleris]
MKTSIIILTYNQLEVSKKCFESLAKYTKEDEVEIIVIDNGSTDGTREYLKSNPSFITIFNEINMGFAKGCNQGIEVATGDNLLFLNNDTIVTENWLDAMLTLLYSNDKIGMVGPVSNYVSGLQRINVDYQNDQEINEFSLRYCASVKGMSKQVLRLVGFCLLVRRELIDRLVGFDERFKLGSFEDDDICLRAILEGYELHIALDSFVHHYGHMTFNGNSDININHLYIENRMKYIEKWGNNLIDIGYPKTEIIEIVPRNINNVLEVGCLAGATGLEIKNLYKCELYGTESDSELSSIASQFYKRVETISIDEVSRSYPEAFFDLIIIDNIVNHLIDPWSFVKEITHLLKPSGSIICRVPNVSHGEVLFQLLQGQWNYIHAGILKKENIRFFTPQTIDTLFPTDQFEVTTKKNENINVGLNIKLFFEEVVHLAHSFGINLDQLSSNLEIYNMLLLIRKK